MQKVAILGAGSLARDLIELVGSDYYACAFAEHPHRPLADLGLEVLHSWDDVMAKATHYVLGVADPELRTRFRVGASLHGLQPCAPVISSTAKIARTSQLGPGSVIAHYVVVGPATAIEVDVLVMHSGTIGHDSTIGEGTVICPGVSIAGHVRVGMESFIAGNAALGPDVTIGARSRLAPGASCLRDVPPGSTVIGNPGRILLPRAGGRETL